MQESFNHKQKSLFIGIITVLTMLMFFFGFNYLKGINVFDKSSRYYATFDNIQGVDRSTLVYLNGYKVGNVRNINFDYNSYRGAVVELALDHQLKIPLNSVAVVHNNPLGAASIQLVLPELVHDYVAANDTIAGQSPIDVMALVTDELIPNLNQTVLTIDSLSNSINTLVNSPDLAETLAQLNASTKAIQSTTRRIDGLMASQVPRILTQVEETSASLKEVSGQVERANVDQVLADLSRVVADLKEVSAQLNSKEGSMGLLLNDPSLYHQIDSAVQSADSLLQDIKANPKRYVNFSIF